MDENKTRGPWYWYVSAAVATLVSTDTSWRFFGERLGIADLWERAVLFAVLEIALVAAGLSMRASVRRTGNPGSARLVAWGLAGASAYMAIELSGPAAGIARVTLGPVLAIIALHQALGIEIKTRHGQRTGTWAKIGRELRERALSWANLGDDLRDAKVRSRERAAVRAATIATSSKPSRRDLRKAILKSEAATNPTTRALLLDTVAALQSLDALSSVQFPSPWSSVPVPSVPVQRPRRLSAAPTSGGPVPGWDAAKVVQMVREGRPTDEIMALANISAKNLQRVKRVMAGGGVQGDLTAAFVQRVQEAMA